MGMKGEKLGDAKGRGKVSSFYGELDHLGE
jgi:hypothetical protein